MQPCDLDAELAPVTGSRQRDMADVELDVEVGIEHPVGAIESERHLHQPRAKGRQLGQAMLEVREHILEAHELPRRGGWIVDSDAADVLRYGRVLEIDEGGVDDS